MQVVFISHSAIVWIILIAFVRWKIVSSHPFSRPIKLIADSSLVNLTFEVWLWQLWGVRYVCLIIAYDLLILKSVYIISLLPLNTHELLWNDWLSWKPVLVEVNLWCLLLCLFLLFLYFLFLRDSDQSINIFPFSILMNYYSRLISFLFLLNVFFLL